MQEVEPVGVAIALLASKGLKVQHSQGWAMMQRCCDRPSGFKGVESADSPLHFTGYFFVAIALLASKGLKDIATLTTDAEGESCDRPFGPKEVAIEALSLKSYPSQPSFKFMSLKLD